MLESMVLCKVAPPMFTRLWISGNLGTNVLSPPFINVETPPPPFATHCILEVSLIHSPSAHCQPLRRKEGACES